MVTACLSEVAASIWAAAARIEGSACFAKSAASKTADVSPNRSKPSTALARTCILASRVNPQQWEIVANSQPPKTRRCHCTHMRAFIP